MKSHIYGSTIIASILASIQHDVNGFGVPMRDRLGKEQNLKNLKNVYSNQRSVPWLVDRASTKTMMSDDNKEPIQEEGKYTSSSDGFDSEGFVSYLAPYVATLVVSLVVTAAFVKFVLLDY